MKNILVALAGRTGIQSLDATGYQEVIAVDGGLDLLSGFNAAPTYFIGDRDSISSSDKIPDSVKTIFLNQIKDETDFEASLNLAESLEGNRVTVVGGLQGPRIDMLLSNIQVACGFALKGLRIRFLDDPFSAYILTPESSISILGQGRVSVLSLSPESEVSIQGMEYTYDGVLKNTSSRGISNSLKKETAGQVSCLSGSILVFVPSDSSISGF